MAILGYLLLIVVLAGVVIAVALVVRRRVLGEDPQEQGVSFTLGDLRAMHAAGELSDAEFEAARGKMIAQHRAMLLAGPAEKNFRDSSDKEAGDDAAGGA